MKLNELANVLNAELVGDPLAEVTSLGRLDEAEPGQISFLSDPKYRAGLAQSKATAVILKQEDAECFLGNKLIMDNPYLGFARVAQLFAYRPSELGVAVSAVVDPSVALGADVVVGANAVIAPNAKIGAGTRIGAGVVIGEGSIIGADCMIFANVTVYHHCVIGDRVVVQANAVIGSDGFGMAKDEQGQWVKIPQLGRVVIGHDVEVGASSTIDRGALGDTVIANNVKLDNQIQIAHNVEIGEGTAIAGCTGIAGSTKIGKHCLIGGAVGIAGHLTITDNVMLTAQSGVTNSIKQPGVYSSTMPIMPAKEWLKNAARFHRLNNLAKRVTQLEKEKIDEKSNRH